MAMTKIVLFQDLTAIVVVSYLASWPSCCSQVLNGGQGKPLSKFLKFVILRDVLARKQSLFEPAINLAQLPEDQNKENRNYEQQK
jgi:hypothetical protein